MLATEGLLLTRDSPGQISLNSPLKLGWLRDMPKKR